MSFISAGYPSLRSMYFAIEARMAGTPADGEYAPTEPTSLRSHLARSITSCLYPKVDLNASSFSRSGGYSRSETTCRKKVMGFWSNCCGLPMLAEMTLSKGSGHSGGVGGSCRDLPQARSLAHLRRGIWFADLRCGPSEPGQPARHGRAHHHDRQPFQIPCHDGLAPGLGHRARRTHRSYGPSRPLHALWLARLHSGCRHCRPRRVPYRGAPNGGRPASAPRQSSSPVGPGA